MEEKNLSSRRKFLQKAVTGTMITAVSPMVFAGQQIQKPVIIPSSAKGANDRLRIAVIGLHGRGGSHIEQIMQVAEQSNVQIATLCDPDMVVLSARQ